ncbi:MAG: NUDIX domain-containing protein [Clostridiales bacterium]|jgi:8-oxo-dGTP pyrophosphatase MutT (NUDIX family)|nr:NUDIX domain-containing protein [Clostridiales bacterium]
MERDWLFSDERGVCSFRTAGVLIRGDKIFVQREKGGNEYALPGGHVKVGETSEEALIREYKEETGADIIVNRLVWVEEIFWTRGKKDAHTVAFYYLIKLKNDGDLPDHYFESHKDNCKVLLEWRTINEIKNLTIYPAFIKDKIESMSDSIEHFISKE